MYGMKKNTRVCVFSPSNLTRCRPKCGPGKTSSTMWNCAQCAEWKVSTERAYRKMMIFVDLRHGQETLGDPTTKNIV